MLKKIDFLLLSIVTITSLQAKDYEIDKNGNVNVNIVDRKVIVNGKVVKTIPKGQPVKVNIGDTTASIDKDKLKANVGKHIGAKVSDDKMSANVGGIEAKIDGDDIKVNVGSVLKNATKMRNSKDTKEEKDFFGNDSFFD